MAEPQRSAETVERITYRLDEASLKMAVLQYLIEHAGNVFTDKTTVTIRRNSVADVTTEYVAHPIKES